MKPGIFYYMKISCCKSIKYVYSEKEHMFIVHDSYNQTEGIVTLEDLLRRYLVLKLWMN